MKILSDAADFMSGGTPNKANPAFWGGDISWYSASNMTDRFIGNDSPKITYEGLIAGSKMAPKGSTLILVRGSGLFNYIPICYVEKAVAFNQDVKAICPKDDTDPVFLHFWMESLRNTLNQNLGVTGIGAGKLDTDFLKNLPFPDLSRKKQEYIAQYAQSFDRKIDLNRRTNETLEAMARALFRDWFIDFGPTRAKMAGEAPYLAPELWELFPDRLDDEGKPEGWHIASIDFLCRITSGKRPPNKETSPSDENPIPVYGGNGISWFTKDILFDQPFLITGRVGTLGTVFRVNEKCWVSDNALCLFPKINSYFEYLYFIISGIDFQSLNSGSTQPLLTQSSLSSQECILPAEEIITIFHAQASVWFEKQQQLEKESHTLAQLRDFMLPKLMSGEISIRDAEKMVENAA